MRTYACTCGNRLFFTSTACVKCGSEVGMCPSCYQIVAPQVGADGIKRCPTAHCDTALTPCKNFRVESVCNQYVAGEAGDEPELCEFCQLTTVIPDLSVPGNREKWYALESAKRRVLYMVRELGFPLVAGESGVSLSFEFKADATEKVFTGHQNGVITINIREADPVEREKARVQFGEPQRTLVGHFRHELGHYIWDRLVKDRDLKRFRGLFGDETDPLYAEALSRYHEQGPPTDWQQSHVSAYATMHPWEDFAETFGAYLDMTSVLDTADDFGVLTSGPGDFDKMLVNYQRVGLLANEWNRDMGLTDLVPEIFTPAVITKLRYIDSLRQRAAAAHDSSPKAAEPTAARG